MSDNEDYGSRIRAARNYANLSQEKLGVKTGIGRKVIIDAEKGEHDLTVRQARQIAEICRVPVSFLVEGWLPSVSERLAAIDARLQTLSRDGEPRLPVEQVELLERVETFLEQAQRQGAPPIAAG